MSETSTPLTPHTSPLTYMQTSSRIYIAGHRGLVGSALMRSLASKGYNNIITRTHAELDLTDQQAVKTFFEQEKPEYVFLAAAKVGGIHANNTYPADFIRINLEIQNNIITQSWKNGVKRLLFLGSSCIYPKECPQPMREEHLLTGPLEPTNRPYALAKIAGIEMCWSFNRQYGTQYLAVMPTNLYGPGDNYDLQNSHVLPALIRKFHLAKMAATGDLEAIKRDEQTYGPIPQDIKESIGLSPHTSPLTPHKLPKVMVWGTGTPKREFLYSDDMADACVFLINLPEHQYSSLLTPHASPLVNIGCGEDQTIGELVSLVKEGVGFDGEIEWDNTKPDGTMKKLLDVSRLASMGWKPRIDLKEGIRSAYEDFLKKH